MPAPAVRFRVDFGREGAIGPGKIALLEHIEHGGSLSQAARDLGTVRGAAPIVRLKDR